MVQSQSEPANKNLEESQAWTTAVTKEYFDRAKQLGYEFRRLQLLLYTMRYHANSLENQNQNLITEFESFQFNTEQKHRMDIQNIEEKWMQTLTDQSRAHEDVLENVTMALKETQDKEFQLQPYKEDITSATAAHEYSARCSNIDAWVDLTLKPMLSNGDFFRAVCAAITEDPNLFRPFR